MTNSPRTLPARQSVLEGIHARQLQAWYLDPVHEKLAEQHPAREIFCGFLLRVAPPHEPTPRSLDHRCAPQLAHVEAAELALGTMTGSVRVC